MGVAVCLDYLRCEEDIRRDGAEVLCIPAYTPKVDPFLPDAPRDHVRLLANCAQYGGSTIMVPDLIDSFLRDPIGVRPVAAGSEAVVLVEYDRFPARPTPYVRAQNRLVLRSEIIEEGTETNGRLGRLETILDRSEGRKPSVAELVNDTVRPGGRLGAFAEALYELQQAQAQQIDDSRLIDVARTHLVVAEGNRPKAVRDRQVDYVWQQLKLLDLHDTQRPLGTALDLYRPSRASQRPVHVFDPDTYIEQVLRPFQRDTSGRLPPVPERYALDLWLADAGAEELRKWISDVVTLWRRQGEAGTAGLADVCSLWLDADTQLRRTAEYDNPQWWREQIRASRPSTSAPADRRGPARVAGTSGGAAAGRGQWPSPSGPALRLTLDQPFGTGQRTEASTRSGRRPTGGAQPRPGRATPTRAQSPVAEAQSASDEGASAGEAEAPPRLSLLTGLRPEMTHDRVILRWNAPPDAPEDVAYTVERAGGRGVKQMSGQTPETAVFDRDPPAGRPLVYRVRATDPATGAESDDALVEVVFAPPVTGLAARQERGGGVTGRWRAHADLWSVEVRRRPAGTPPGPADVPIQPVGDGFGDPKPPIGRHTYRVVPSYRDPDTKRVYEGQAAQVEVRVHDRPPLVLLEMNESEGSGPAAFALRWGELPAEVSVLLRRTATEPSGAVGDLVMIEEARRIGQPVAEGLTGTGAVVTLPAGRWILIPFAVAGDRAVRGDGVGVDVIPPVTDLDTVRNGAEVEVTWRWPDGLRLARIVWIADGAESVREVVYSDYLPRGSVIFRRGEAAEVRVIGLVRSGAELLTAAPVGKKVPEQPPTLTYHVSRVSRFLPWSRTRRVAVSADRPCGGVHLEIYLRMPIRGPDAEVALAAVDDLHFGPGCPHVVRVELPRTAETDVPCYVTCRASNDAWRDQGRSLPQQRPGGAVIFSVTCPYCYRRIDRLRLWFVCSGRPAPGYSRCEKTVNAARQRETGYEEPMYPVFRPQLKYLPSPRQARCRSCRGVTGEPACPVCHTPLPPSFSGGFSPVIALVGAKSTGKTVYLVVLASQLLSDLRDRFRANTWLYGDDARDWLNTNVAAIFKQHILPALTQQQPGGRSEPLVFEWRRRRSGRVLRRYRSSYLSFLDTAGESLGTQRGVAELKFLTGVNAFIVALDPFTLPGARDMLNLPEGTPTAGSPALDVLGQVTGALRKANRANRAGRITMPIAVAFTKIDAFRDYLGMGHPIFSPSPNDPWYDEAAGRAVHQAMRELLLDLGAREIDEFMDAHYARYRYFPVSSLGRPPDYQQNTVADDGVKPLRVTDPLVWLLSLYRLVPRRTGSG